MLARLWWKEARVFGPVWVVLLVAAAILQWFLVSARSEDVQSGALTVVNLIWALLYACAASSAAFAGERESNTLGFLDALPVRRRTLWLGKATFAMASTFGLALMLAALAEVGTVLRASSGMYTYYWIALTLGTWLFEASAWGLFWSALMKNPLLAGAMTAVSVVSSLMFSGWLVNRVLGHVGPFLYDYSIIAVGLTLAVLALGASAVVMTWRPSRGRSFRWPSASWPSVVITLPLPSTGQRLAWQAGREGWSTGFFVVLVGLFFPLGVALLVTPLDGLVELCAVAIAGLVAGVSVFGLDDASKGRRFLAHHGAGPGTVWWWKLLAWGAGMVGFLALMSLAIVLFEPSLRYPQVGTLGPPGAAPGLLVATVVDAFAVGVVCGMVIRRRITAALVGVMVLIAVLPLQLGLASWGIVPAWSLILVPLILLGISRAWAGDWLLEREGPRPWLKLLGLIVVPFGLLGASYVAYRAFGVADVGPQFDPLVVRGPAIPPDQDAAEVYRRATGLIVGEPNFYNDYNGSTSVPVDRAIADGWDPKQGQVVRFRENNRGAIDLARKASTMPGAVFEPDLASRSIASGLEGWKLLRGMKMLGQLLALDARERVARGDLPGAWDDILAQFRMSLQLGTSSPTLARMATACHVHHQAVGLAFDWLGDARQTPESTRRALGDLKSLPTLPNLVETLQVESSIIERSLDLPADDLADAFKANGSLPSTPSTWDFLFFTKLVATPWERERVRRICRKLIAEELATARSEPWQGERPGDRGGSTWPEFQASGLARMIFPSFLNTSISLDNELVGRRALDQAIALVAWKLDHGGRYPDKLDDIVPGLLDRLPPDPFSGRPFGYVRSEGQSIAPLLGSTPRPTRPGQPLIYSVGRDRADNGGKTSNTSYRLGECDLIFAVP